MNTSVNSNTWISVGNSTPTTASEAPCIANAPVAPIATMTNRTACIGVRCGGNQGAEHERAPHHEAEPRCILDQSGDDCDRGERKRDATLRQEILAIVQPGDFGRVV